MATVIQLEVLDGQVEADFRRWEELVQAAPVPDVYYRPGYVQAYEAVERCRAMAVVARRGRAGLLFPLLERTFQVEGHAESYRDALTPYGYGGVVALSGPEPPAKEDVAAALQALEEWCRQRQLVACTVRFHPLLDQLRWLAGLPLELPAVRCQPLKPTVALELTQWDTEQGWIAGMSENRRRDLRLARRHLRTAWANGPVETREYLRIFQGLYEENMRRLSASPFYFFPSAYYDALVVGVSEDMGVVVCWLGNQPVGAAIFLAGRAYAHYHLGGTNQTGLEHKAATLFINEGAAWARSRGCQLLHLGGGVSPRDSLWEFKKRFGGKIYEYSSVTVVGDPEPYARLRNESRAPWPYGLQEGEEESKGATKVAGIGAGEHARAPGVRIGKDRHALGVVFMGKDKPICVAALRYLVSSGVRVSAVVGPAANATAGSGRLREIAASCGIPTATDQQLYEQVAGAQDHGLNLSGVDLVISFLFWRRIKRPLIELGKMGCINFHPAPLPEFRGVGGYNLAIYEEHKTWGAAAHFVDESFDTGDLIRVDRFPIDAARETASSLEQKTLIRMLQMFKELISGVLAGQALPRKPQGEGRYISKEDFERVRRVTAEDTPEQVARKIRAFWYPPQQGAFIEIDGKEFTLVNEELLQTEIGDKYHR